MAEAHNNLGNILQMAGSHEEAVARYRTAVNLRPSYAEAYRNMGSALRQMGMLDEAVTALRAALDADPGSPGRRAIGAAVERALRLDQMDVLTAELVDIVEAGSAAVEPVVFLSLETTPRMQLLCAKRWAADHLGAIAERPTAARGGDRITIGYCLRTFRSTPPRT